MGNSEAIEYRGHSIFRNQPNHSYFDKPFEDEDCLFQFLHDIDPHFLKPQQKAESINLSNMTLTDPRTGKPITRVCYDHTKEDETKIFNYSQKSLMTEREHELGVNVLRRLQQSLEVEEEDMYKWHRLQRTRLKEHQYFQKFVFEFNQSKEQIYAPCRKLLEVYQNWYNNKVIRLMKRYPPEAYNTHLGLPSVRQCKNVLRDQAVMITNQEIVSTVGEPCFWQESLKEELKIFNYSISSYAEVYKNSEDLRDSLEDNLQMNFVKIVEQDTTESPHIYIPLESLIFLLVAGDYIDMPTEMLLNIKETENDSKKYIVMDLPLPSRQCGLHTHVQVVEQAALAMLSLKQENSVEEGCLNNNFASNNYSAFKVSTWQDFMLKSKFTADKLCKFSKTLAKWQLSDLEDDYLQLYTSFDSFVKNKSVTLKLEHKPRLGCEVLTKCEILKEWLKLKLVGASNSSCLRLSTTNYKTLLEEPLNELKLEQCLSSMYHINSNILLNNLFEFLKMLYNMPLGHYMLRYNPKFKDKIMLCKPSREITQNTIHLHKMLNTNVTDIEFMSQQNGLPIDENLCSLMHLQHKILPAAFSPRAKGNQLCSQAFGRKITKVVQPMKEFKKPVLNKTRQKRMRRKRRELAALQLKNEIRELEQQLEGSKDI